MEYHVPVLLKESIDGLEIKPNGIYVDATFGGGGHSEEILKNLSSEGKLIAFDQDTDAVERAKESGFLEKYAGKLTLVDKNFRYIKNYLRLYGIREVDGILADLGVSSHQFDCANRGFTIREKADLDMRMDRRESLTAKEILANYSAEKLADLFFKYANLPFARKLASDIERQRQVQPIEDTEQLNAIIDRYTHKGKENKIRAVVYQALRMEVNGEESALEDFLRASEEVLKLGGRLCVISYHSIEDRLVKNFIRSGSFTAEIKKDFFGNKISPFKIISRHAITPTQEELEANSRSRSAKLRIGERI